jgi:hypothetical protein
VKIGWEFVSGVEVGPVGVREAGAGFRDRLTHGALRRCDVGVVELEVLGRAGVEGAIGGNPGRKIQAVAVRPPWPGSERACRLLELLHSAVLGQRRWCFSVHENVEPTMLRPNRTRMWSICSIASSRICR